MIQPFPASRRPELAWYSQTPSRRPEMTLYRQTCLLQTHREFHQVKEHRMEGLQVADERYLELVYDNRNHDTDIKKVSPCFPKECTLDSYSENHDSVVGQVLHA